ncbi:hypothetical protein TNCV_3823101 [Trichonephila clavipes]|nr:hypothetical protein TNCV_3823101 [Trichonephila clavipes]
MPALVPGVSSSWSKMISSCLSKTSLASQIAIYLSNRVCLGYEGKMTASTGNVDDLARQLEQIWQEMPQETIRVPYNSMSRRVAACIQTRGASTPY